MRADGPEHRWAKRSLSQNFLIDPNLQKKILRELEAGPAEAVLEIGAGHGELGGRLAGRVAEIVLVEKDDDHRQQRAYTWSTATLSSSTSPR